MFMQYLMLRACKSGSVITADNSRVKRWPQRGTTVVTRYQVPSICTPDAGLGIASGAIVIKSVRWEDSRSSEYSV